MLAAPTQRGVAATVPGLGGRCSGEPLLQAAHRATPTRRTRLPSPVGKASGDRGADQSPIVVVTVHGAGVLNDRCVSSDRLCRAFRLPCQAEQRHSQALPRGAKLQCRVPRRGAARSTEITGHAPRFPSPHRRGLGGVGPHTSSRVHIRPARGCHHPRGPTVGGVWCPCRQLREECAASGCTRVDRSVWPPSHSSAGSHPGRGTVRTCLVTVPMTRGRRADAGSWSVGLRPAWRLAQARKGAASPTARVAPAQQSVQRGGDSAVGHRGGGGRLRELGGRRRVRPRRLGSRGRGRWKPVWHTWRDTAGDASTAEGGGSWPLASSGPTAPRLRLGKPLRVSVRWVEPSLGRLVAGAQPRGVVRIGGLGGCDRFRWRPRIDRGAGRRGR